MALTDLSSVSDMGTVTAEDLDSIGNQQGQAFSRGVKTSQLRSFYSAINGIRVQFRQQRDYTPDVERRLILLKPRLAYAAGRHPQQLRAFRDFMLQAIDAVTGASDKPQALDNFLALLEAIVAYHRFYGGKDN